MEWHLSKGQCTQCCEVVKQTGTAAAYKQTGIKSFRITRILLLALNSVFFKGFCSAYWGLLLYCIAL